MSREKEKPTVPGLIAWGAKTAVLGVKNLFFRPEEEPVPAVREEEPEHTGPVVIRQGMLVGVYNSKKTVEVYAGIPYAKPPVGDLRWKEPQPPEKWEGIFQADHFAPMSMQKAAGPVFDSIYQMKVYNRTAVDLKKRTKPPVSEDSLYLNIWKPAGEQRDLPVLFFIHGGSLESGQTWFEDYNGESLAAKGIIVVNFAYRLGIFGYLALPALAGESPNGTTGNYGLLDQIQALKWVWSNISAFGGDPDNITIAGESAGACAVNALCVSPLAKGLFRRAIAESGGILAREAYHSFRNLDDAFEAGAKVCSELMHADLEKLRNTEARRLLKLKAKNNAMTVDGYAITKEPWQSYACGENNEEALLGGYNLHEADLFTMLGRKPTAQTYRERLKAAVGEHAAEAELFYPAQDDESAKRQLNLVLGGAWFGYSHHLWAQELDRQGRSSYQYYFAKDNARLGANHAGELVYAYGNLRYHAPSYDGSDRKLSTIMKDYWVNFVKRGDPNGEGLPEWKSYAGAPGCLLRLDRKIEMIKDPCVPLYQVIGRYQDDLVRAREARRLEARQAQEAEAEDEDTDVSNEAEQDNGEE